MSRIARVALLVVCGGLAGCSGRGSARAAAPSRTSAPEARARYSRMKSVRPNAAFQKSTANATMWGAFTCARTVSGPTTVCM